MNEEPNDKRSGEKQDNRWLFGIVMGIGVAVALSVSLDSITMGIPIGIGAGFVFSAGLYQQGKRKDKSNSETPRLQGGASIITSSGLDAFHHHDGTRCTFLWFLLLPRHLLSWQNIHLPRTHLSIVPSSLQDVL